MDTYGSDLTDWYALENRTLTKGEQFAKVIQGLPVVPIEDRTIVLLDIYNSVYMASGEYGPMSTVCVRKEEDISEIDPLRMKLRIYDTCKLERYFGSFPKYLEATPYMATMVAKYAKERLDTEASQDDGDLSKLKKQLHLKE